LQKEPKDECFPAKKKCDYPVLETIFQYVTDIRKLDYFVITKMLQTDRNKTAIK
jgi:hypothetical protein